MRGAYYNEIDPYAAQWLRNLIAAGHIAPGDVDERSIEDVRPDDLRGYTQCHFFAGIGVWSYALRRAGWPDDKPVWTGSCPCQPFSAAGKGNGFTDERHLWPAFFHLIEQCRPGVIFGEQVASKDGLHWLDLVQTDLEGTGYTSAAVDLCAAGIGAPHIRQRLYWVAHTDSEQREWCRNTRPARWNEYSDCGADGWMGITNSERCSRFEIERNRKNTLLEVARSGSNCNTEKTNGHWQNADWLGCRDGKWRPVEPGTFPLAHGITNRVGRLRAYDNAIVAPVAETFIRVYMEVQ
ncbi:DNA cytosine methyltransferase [Xenorhabdus sp. 12]|uniref:DNA cytosine methyltransferase n=1 Tax=Xenorhabdus santafensis TaxID=2582833 RepID=A0ABU4SD05_9GAMM|nr:DNA cytosine methyltransferase [Xenorhabdus sp. 12]MDX7988635.1 DNA cytosine methyltransferase [Xenorhabdus sp. 12]